MDVVQESTLDFLCEVKRHDSVHICKYIQHDLCETACNNRQLLSSGDDGGAGIRRLGILRERQLCGQKTAGARVEPN